MKKNVMIRIDAELVKKAKDLGLNISKITENALKRMIEKLEAPDYPEKPENSSKNYSGSPGEIRTPVSGSRARHA